MERRALEVGTTVHYTRPKEEGPEDFKRLDFDAQNSEIAQRAIEEALKLKGWDAIRGKVEPEHIDEGLSRRPPCR